jgi:hypothetical protein
MAGALVCKGLQAPLTLKEMKCIVLARLRRYGAAGGHERPRKRLSGTADRGARGPHRRRDGDGIALRPEPGARRQSAKSALIYQRPFLARLPRHSRRQLFAREIGSRALIVAMPPMLAHQGVRVLGWIVRDVINTRDEVRGLMQERLYVDSPPLGTTKLSDWVRASPPGDRTPVRQRIATPSRPGGRLPFELKRPPCLQLNARTGINGLHMASAKRNRSRLFSSCNDP